jgi:hypothetical protein
MISHTCEREPEILTGIHSGIMELELRKHASDCPVCSEVLLVTEWLKSASPSSAGELEPPPADLVWKKARHRSRELAMAHALRPIRFMNVLAGLTFPCLALAAVFSQFGPGWFSRWSALLGLLSCQISRSWPATLSEPMVVVGFAAMFVFLCFSSWYVLQTE